jgi:hypothetical protein
MEHLPERVINPFGRTSKKLDVKLLTLEQKQWLVDEVLDHQVTYKVLTDRYGLGHSYLKGLVHKHL